MPKVQETGVPTYTATYSGIEAIVRRDFDQSQLIMVCLWGTP